MGVLLFKYQKGISIHALREEGDVRSSRSQGVDTDFYPRPPRGGRRFHHLPSAFSFLISIHALREEGDDAGIDYNALDLSFYPRPPRGGRPYNWALGVGDYIFLSTPSARRATHVCGASAGRNVLSIHALREEGDCFSQFPSSSGCTFYPRPPRGGRPEAFDVDFDSLMNLSIHALREEGDHQSTRL